MVDCFFNSSNTFISSTTFTTFKQSRHDIQPISNLIFGNNEQEQFYDIDKQEKIIAEIMKVIDFQLLRDRVQTDLIPKFDICKKIAKHRLLYYSEGGRDKLSENRHIPIDKELIKFYNVEENWCKYVKNWETEITQLRRDFNVLTFYTVNDMRWILLKINSYLDLGVGQEKNKLLRELHAAFCFIDSSLSLDECRYETTKINSKPNTMTELGDVIQKAFGNRILNFIKLDQFDYQFLASGKPHLFLCQQRSAILRTVMKLFLSQGQQPAASRVSFCNENTTLEEIECLLMRSNLRYQGSDNNNNNNNNNRMNKPNINNKSTISGGQYTCFSSMNYHNKLKVDFCE